MMDDKMIGISLFCRPSFCLKRGTRQIVFILLVKMAGNDMPIRTMFEPRHVSEEEFREIDFQTIGLAFDIQNEMGRFWSEEIYQDELAYRCRKGSFDKVDIEAQIKVSFRDFT